MALLWNILKSFGIGKVRINEIIRKVVSEDCLTYKKKKKKVYILLESFIKHLTFNFLFKVLCSTVRFSGKYLLFPWKSYKIT